jgi:hypothetical protein
MHQVEKENPENSEIKVVLWKWAFKNEEIEWSNDQRLMAINLMNQGYFLRLQEQEGQPLPFDAAMGFAKIIDIFVYEPPEVLNKHEYQKQALQGAIGRTIETTVEDPQAVQIIIDKLIKQGFKKHYGQSLN